jgi:hypothetical protein
MLLIEFAGTANSLKHMNDALPHFVLVILGRTKGNQLSGSKFGIPCRIWVAQLVPLMKEAGVTGGRLFQRVLTPSKLFEFEHDFSRSSNGFSHSWT